MKHRYINSFKSIAVFALLWLTALSVRQANAQITLTIGSGTGTTARFPIYSCYGYNYSQQIYLESELSAAGATGPGFITKVAFKTGPSTVSVTNWKDWVIYMGNTTTSTFASTSSWIPYSELTEVWNGTILSISASSWVEFELDEPFYWDGSSNLVVAVDENTSSYTCTQYWASYSAGSNRGILYYSDGTNPNPVSPPNANYGPNSTLAQVQFEYIPAVSCDEVEFAVGTLSAPTVCPSQPFSVTNTGSIAASGVTRIWQQRVPSGTGTWTTIAGATGVNYSSSTGITEPTDYRCIVSCDVTGETDTTNEVTVELNPFLDCYCIPTVSYGCTYGSHVASFKTEGAVVNIENLGTGCASGVGYSDYSADHVCEAVQFSEVTQTTTVGSYSGGVKIWVDWNQDGIFHPTDELVAASASTIVGGSSFTSTFTVPLTALPGETRMRVRVVESYTTFSPCDNWYYGEAEDYAFVVIPATLCDDESILFPSSIESIATPNMVCGTGNSTLSVDDSEIPLAVGITYEWQSAPTATGPWTTISTPSIYDEFYVADISANTYFRCQIKCMDNLVLNTEPVMVESVVPELPTLFEAQNCGPGAVTLTGESPSGTIFWFEEPTGGTPFAVGDTVLSPEIEETTTFYAAAGAYPPALVQIGESSTTITTVGGPFNQWYRRTTSQMMYTAEQLLEAGAMAGTFDEIRFFMANPIAYSFPGYTISIKFVPPTMTTLTWQTDGFTTIFGGSTYTYSPSGSGWQSFSFDPIYWDGVSNIVIQACWAQTGGYSSTAGGHQYTLTPGQMLYAQTDAAGNSCGQTGTTSSSYLPNVIFNFNGCVSDRIPVTAHIREVPTIDIPVEDGEYCMFNNEFLLPTTPAQPNDVTFLWHNGTTDTFATVTGEGTLETYWVEVTNQWGCQDSDTVHLVLKPSPVVDLGDDLLTCEGGTMELDAGEDGVDYYWNTGETTQTIIADDGGYYWVLVTNEYGCMATDTVYLTIEGFAPSIDGIIVDNLGTHSFQFTPFHPMYIISYHWDFGDGYTSTDPAPSHTYDAPGTYMVTLEVSSTCGKREYYTYVTIVQSVEELELSKNNVKLYPNPTQNLVTIETIGDVYMNSITVVNNLGQEVMTHALETKSQKVALDVSRLPSGVYHVRIDSDRGTLLKQFQVLK